MIVNIDNRTAIKLYLELTTWSDKRLYVVTDKRIVGCTYSRRHNRKINWLTV